MLPDNIRVKKVLKTLQKSFEVLAMEVSLEKIFFDAIIRAVSAHIERKNKLRCMPENLGLVVA